MSTHKICWLSHFNYFGSIVIVECLNDTGWILIILQTILRRLSRRTLHLIHKKLAYCKPNLILFKFTCEIRMLNALASGDDASTDRYNFLSNELSTSTYTAIE